MILTLKIIFILFKFFPNKFVILDEEIDRKPLRFGFLYPTSPHVTFQEKVAIDDRYIIDADSRRYIWCWMNKSETIRLAKCANQFTTKCKAFLHISKDLVVLKRSQDQHNDECLSKTK